MSCDIMETPSLNLPAEAWRDHKKLTKFLKDVTVTVNKLIKGCQEQSKVFAIELINRPTYAEEFQNIRDNVHKAVITANQSHYTNS